MVFAAGILIFCPAFSFAQSRTVRLNETAFAYAKELIVQGRVVIDKKNAWRDHQLTAEGENALIRAHGFAQYGKWHLGIDETHAEGTKARYKFPFGDFKNVHRCGLLAVKSRAHQFGYADIEKAATQLIEIINSKRKIGPARNTDCQSVRPAELTSAERTMLQSNQKSHALRNASINSGRSSL